MVSKKPRIVIIGAGMAGLTAANKLYTCAGFKDMFELSVVEAGSRIGGRINTSEFCGDRIELGATWIHGIGGSPVHRIAQEINSLESEQPWECMDGFMEDPVTIAEGGYELNPSLVEPLSSLFKNLMDFAQGKKIDEDSASSEILECVKVAAKCSRNGSTGNLSVGSFLQKGLDAYWELMEEQKEVEGVKNWTRKSLEEAIFAMHECTQRTYTGAGDLHTLDYNAESEYVMFPGEEITIAKGYSTVIQSLASVLPADMIQLSRKVAKIEWQPNGNQVENGHVTRPVKLHFIDGSTMYADHVIITVSLGVLKKETGEKSGMFSPPLPSFKTDAISRLGYGVVNKLFLQLSEEKADDCPMFPFLQMVFHQPHSSSRQTKIPWWIRRTATLCPIYNNSRVLLSWFAGQEALELESLNDEEILTGVSTTVSNLLSSSQIVANSPCNGVTKFKDILDGKHVKFAKVLRTQWGTDPLFLGSYSYIAVGSSIDDMDALAEPLPESSNLDIAASLPQLQILFAGEATHSTHYSTTHGAYHSGLREANRLLQHYHINAV